MATENIVTSTSTPAWLTTEYQNVVNRAVEESKIPYEPYPAARQAEFTEDQEQAFTNIRNQQGFGQDLLQEGLGFIRQAGQAPTTAGIAQYMNPYDELVTQNILSEMTRQNEIGALGDAASAAKSGAFGGSRHGIVESERARNHERAMADYLGKANQQNYNQALKQFNTQQEIGMGTGAALGAAGQQLQGMNASDTRELLGIGSLQQVHDQDAYNLAYQDYQRQLQYPKEQIGFLNDIIQGRGMTSNRTQTEARTTPDPSSSSQWANVAMQGLGFVNKYGSTIGKAWDTVSSWF